MCYLVPTMSFIRELILHTVVLFKVFGLCENCHDKSYTMAQLLLKIVKRHNKFGLP